MAYVTDDEAERIAGYRQQQGLASKPAPAPAPDPFANWQDTVDFAPPAVYGPFQPSPAPQPSYSLTGQGFDDFNVGNQMGPFEPYDLGFERRGVQSPVLFQPEPEPFYDPRGAAFQASQRSQSNPFLEDFGASLQETGNLFADRTQRLPGLVEGLGGMFGFGGRAGGLPETEQLGEIYQKDILPNVSGNEFIRSFTPYEPENLPGPLPYLTDALAPINFATAGIASEVPVLGAMFKGPYLANLGAEMGIDIGARFGAEQAAGERGASVPLFGEQPAWLRGLEGSLAGGLGAAGAIKGADAGIPALGRYLDEPIEVAPGQFVSRGEFGGGKFGPVEGEPPKLAADAGPVMDARRTLLDALQQEATIRRTGTAAAEISAGRAKQAAGIGSAIEGLQPNATIDEALQAARGGATAGPLRQTFAAPLELAPEVQSQLVREIIEGSAGKQFDTLRALKALDKLQAGEGLQPNEIKLLRTIYGDEVADSIVRVNRGRIITTPELTDADLAEIGRRAVVDGRRVARLEVTAQRQLEIADNLQRQSYMDPTNTRLQKAAEEARARGIAQQNEAERLMIDRASRVEAGQQAKAFKAEQAEAGKGSRAEARTNEAYDLKHPNSEMVIQRAEKMLGEIPYQSSALRQDHIEAIRLWLKQTEMHLDAVGDDAPGLVRSLYAGATGEVSDSFTAALIDQRAVLRSTLEAQGLPDTMAKTIAKLLQDAELRARYGENVPQHVLDALEEAKSLPYGSEGAIGGLASISQELKNTQFGIGDLAVFGQQGLKVGTTNAVQFLVGSVNRLLHMAHLPSMDTTLADVTLPKRIVYQLDGVAQSSKGVTDLTNEGTILRHLGKGGQFLDEKALVPATRLLTDFQFKTVLTNIRNVVYEGNLILAKASGADISDPLVRSNAAAWANAATGAGKLAQDTGRAQFEKAFLLSPSMRRAQIQQVGQVARGLTGGTRVDRVLAAATITSTAGALLGVGKLLNDYVGLEEFEFDPSKPGFGNITLPGGTVVNLFPQEQFVKAVARSIGVLAREGFGEAEAKDIAKEWAKFLVSSASPAVRPFLAGMGVGYDPGRGWRFGDLGEGKGLAERALDAAPLPPIAQSIAREGVDAMRTPLEALGVNAYKEGAYGERDRALTTDTEFGKPYKDLEPWQKLAAEEKYGRVYSNDPKIAASQRQADTLQEEQRAKQEVNDGRLQRGEITPQQWRDERSRDDAYFAGRFDQLYAGVNFADKSLSPVDLYYKAIADATDRATGDVDWDKVDAWKAAQGPEALAYIERNTNLRDTNLEQQWRRDVKLLGDSGYFDAENKVAVRKADPEIAAAVRRWGYSEMSVKAEDTVMRYTAQQEVDDRSLEQGAITPEQWRENYNTRRDQLRAEKDGIYAGMKDDGVSTDPIDAYFKEIEKAVTPNGIDIDWQQVDAWVAQQPADVQASINSYASPGLTPVVDQYRADVKKIVESQYWDVSDRVTQYWAKANGFDWTEGTDADKFWGDIQQEVYQRVQAKGFAPLEARSLTNVVMGQLQKDYVDVSSKVRAALRDSNPELARLLVQWGYWEPSKSDTGELIASGVLR